MLQNTIKGLLLSTWGSDVWEQVLRDSGVEGDGVWSNTEVSVNVRQLPSRMPHVSHVPLQECDDSVTYSLVGAACAVLKLPLNTVIEAAGGVRCACHCLLPGQACKASAATVCTQCTLSPTWKSRCAQQQPCQQDRFRVWHVTLQGYFRLLCTSGSNICEFLLGLNS